MLSFPINLPRPLCFIRHLTQRGGFTGIVIGTIDVVAVHAVAEGYCAGGASMKGNAKHRPWRCNLLVCFVIGLLFQPTIPVDENPTWHSVRHDSQMSPMWPG